MDEIRKLMEDLKQQYLAKDFYYSVPDSMTLMHDVSFKLRYAIESLSYNSLLRGGKPVVFTVFDVLEILQFVLAFPDEINRQWVRRHQNDQR